MKEILKFKEIVPASDILKEELANINGGSSSEFNFCCKGCVTGDKEKDMKQLGN